MPDRRIDCERFLRDTWRVETGEIDPADRAAWEDHREACPECRRALAETAAALEAYAEASDLDLDDDAFDRMVARARRESDRPAPADVSRGSPGPGLRSFLGAAAAIALIVLGAALGRWTARDAAEADALRAELRAARAEAALASMEGASASERIHGVLLASRIERPAPDVLGAVMATLETDPSPNVRLAAVDALRLAADLSPVRSRLVAALESEPSPAIRIAIIDLLAERGVAEGVGALERLEREADDPAVRERAARARRALS